MSAAIIQMAGSSRAIHLTWQALRQASNATVPKRGESAAQPLPFAGEAVDTSYTPRRAL